MDPHYKQLLTLSKEAKLLGSMHHLLSWDQETYMPKKAAHHRGETVELISKILHEKSTSTEYEKLLQTLIDIQSGKLRISCSEEEARNLECLRKDFIKHKKLPTSFVQQEAKLHCKAFSSWVEAKKNSNFSIFASDLSEVFSMAKKKASYLGFSSHPYNALLDLYEEGMTVEFLDPLFDTLRQFLKQSLSKLTKKKIELSLTIPGNNTVALFSLLMNSMGLDPQKVRLDHAEHPFCSAGHPTDVRMTIHASPTQLFHNLSALLHEGGHALYEQNLKESAYGTPLGEACSLGVHESQSRFWEVFVGQSMPFCKFLSRELTNYGAELSAQKLFAHLNSPHPSFIRIHADELTYLLHVLLRYTIEKEIFEETLSIDGIPHRWNSLMEEFLGITPPYDALGCLQDVHWSHGLIGYFPTYALGMIYGAQLFEAFTGLHPEWKEAFEEGNFKAASAWLSEKIHTKGRLYKPNDLIMHATGKAVSIDPLIRYYKQKYDI